jgi:hypothetical protein
MATCRSPAERYALIRRDLTEVLGEDRLKEVLETRDAVVYWETAPTRRESLCSRLEASLTSSHDSDSAIVRCAHQDLRPPQRRCPRQGPPRQ